MSKNSDIHIFIPAYNEQNVIAEVVKNVLDCGFSNIYVVNDGSTDETAKYAAKAGAKVIPHSLNRGAGAANQTGIAYAKRKNLDYIVFLDGDGQHYPEDIEKMSDLMQKENIDLVIGSRFIEDKQAVPIIRRIYNFIANILTLGFKQGKYSDTQCGFRMLNRKAIETINLEIDGFGYCSEMIWKAELNQLKIKEMSVHVRYTEHSMEKGQDLITGMKTGFDLVWKKIFS
jgi:glycosyltransferase involved in cell wall biosynthesis